MYTKFINYYLELDKLTKESGYLKDDYVLVPYSAIERLLDTFPNESFLNLNYKWLDISVGYGNFIVVLIHKLMKTLSKEIPSDEKRFKHIVENMIYLSDESEYYLSNLSNIFDKELNINIINYKNSENLDEKYDFIISKTMYKHNKIISEYKSFYEKIIKISGKKIGILIDKNNLNNNISTIFEVSNNNIIINLNKDFGLYNKLDYALLSSEPYSRTNVEIIRTNNIIIDMILSLDIEKLYSKRTKAYIKSKEIRDSYTDKKTDVFKYKHFVNSCGPYNTPYRYLDYKIDETFKPKVYMTEFIGTGKNKNLGKIYIDRYGEVGLATDSSMCIYEDNVDRLERIYDYISSDLVKYFINKYCDSSHANGFIRQLPDITIYDRNVDDAFINEIFGFVDYKKLIYLQNKLDSLFPSDKVSGLFYDNILDILDKDIEIIFINDFIMKLKIDNKEVIFE